MYARARVMLDVRVRHLASTRSSAHVAGDAVPVRACQGTVTVVAFSRRSSPSGGFEYFPQAVTPPH
jgi:hypothetical protein